MADNDLKVIVKAKELAVHSFKLTSNCNRYPNSYVFEDNVPEDICAELELLE